jgi:membrane protease YdiL (CAAX protease family)
LGLIRFKKEILAQGVALFLICYFFIILSRIFLKLINIDIPEKSYDLVFEQSSQKWLIFFEFSIFNPFVEEFFDRGFIFSGLCIHMSWKKAAILSSALFALAHISSSNLYGFIPAFIFGMALAYLYHKSKSILPGFFLHALNNFIVLGIAYKQYISG